MRNSRDIDRICDEFEAAWQAGEVPNVEEFLTRIDEQHRPVLLQALMPLDFTYRGKLGETIDSGAAAGSGKADSGFEVTLDSDADTAGKAACSGPKPGKRVKYFGEYELLSEIARGGMGVVYKARQVKLNRIVALKMILSGEFAGSEAIQRFHSEAESAANLDHPGIVPIYEIGEHEGQHYFSMGFIDGPSLQGKLAAGPMPAKEAARLCRKIAEAVAYAHSKNVIHRDLKPANVLIDGNGEPKVTDFGLAKKVEGDSGLTRTGTVMGTPSYMPPEQALGQTDKIGPAADVYSLGAILYCMLTGRPPFQAANVVDTLKQVVDNEPVTPRTLDSKIPLDLETICLKCLEKNPANRYATTQELVDELNRFEKGEPIKARRIGPTAKTARWCQRNPVVSSLLAATVILLLISLWTLKGESRQRRVAEDQREIAIAKTQEASKSVLSFGVSEMRNHRFQSGVDQLIHAWRLREDSDPLKVPYARVVTDALTRGGKSWVTLRHPKSGINLVAFGPDRSRIVSASSDGSVIVWDARTGETIGEPMLHKPSINAVAFSLDGRQIVTVSGNRSVSVWDAITHRKLGDTFQLETPITKVTWSSDGNLLALVWSDNTVRIWDVRLRNLIGEPLHHESHVSAFACNSDGTTLATATSAKILTFWNAHSGEILGGSITTESNIVDMAFSPDGNRIATTALDKTVRQWDVRSRSTLGEPMQHGQFVKSAMFSPDGMLIATISLDKAIRLWDARTGVPRGNPILHEEPVGSVAFSPDGSRIATKSPLNTASIWDSRTGQRIGAPIIDDFQPGAIAFSPDGTRVALPLTDKTVRIWDANTGNPIGKPMKHNIGVGSIVFINDGKELVTASSENSTHRWDARTGKSLGDFSNHNVPIKHIAFGPNKKHFATASWQCVAQVWDSLTGAPVGEPMRHKLQLTSLAFSPDGTRLATASMDKTARIWNARTGEPLGQPMHHEGQVLAIVFSPDGKRLATGSFDSTAQLWDAMTGSPLGEPIRHASVVSDVAFSPDGKRLATSSGKTRIWDVEQIIPTDVSKYINSYADDPNAQMHFDADFQSDLNALIAKRVLQYRTMTAMTAVSDPKANTEASDAPPSTPMQNLENLHRTAALEVAAYKRSLAVPEGHDNLLASVDLTTNWSTGQWVLKDGLLEGIEKDSVIEFPYTPPEEYHMTAIVEPLDEPFSLLLKQRLAGHSFWVTLAYNNKNSLELVDGVAIPNETTHHGQLLRQGEQAEVVVTVKKESVQVSVDGEQIIGWKGDSSRLSLNHKTPIDEALAVSTNGCRYRIHRLSIEPLSGKGRVLPGKAEVEPDDLFGDPTPK